ncbi:MAG: helix-turn-helix domain-containing protein [Bacteroidota bacterium]
MQQPSLDHWTVIFLLAGAQGLFLATVLFFQKKGNTQANRLLGVIMLLFGISLLYYVAYWTGYITILPSALQVIFILPLVFGPLFLFYFKLLYQKKLRSLDAWHLLLFAVYFVFNFPRYIGWEPAWAETLYSDSTYVVRVILFNGQTLAYALYLFFYLKKQYTASSLSFAQYRWMKKAAFCYAGFAVSLAMYYVLYLTIDFDITHDYAVSFFMAGFIYLAGYLGYRQPEILSGQVTKPKKTAPKYAKSSLTPTEATFHLKNIIRYMKEEQPFLDCELKMDDLAQQLNLSKHAFSQIINDKLQQNFADFINHYRVEEAQRLLAKPANQQEKIISIAYDAGFRNKASFYNAFKKRTGVSPTQYRDRILSAREQKKRIA